MTISQKQSVSSALKLVSNPNKGYADKIFLARYEDVRHLIESGSLVYTWLDLEATDKDWLMAEITVASLTITDIGYNLISDDLIEVSVPDRVGLSPEAMLITRYMAPKVRDPRRLSPQKAAAQIYETVQSAPRRLWQMLGDWEHKLGSELWQAYVDQREIIIPGRTGKGKPTLVRHFPTLNDKNEIMRSVRVHEPSPQKEFMEMSYIVNAREAADYEDESGRWKIKQLDKYNLGFRNTFFDNRLMAAALFRANFPQKEIYALNRKGLGNHSADVFTIALSDHFYSTQGRARTRLGSRTDPETSREKISAKLDLIMEENTRHSDPDIKLPEGVRVYDGTLHNLKRGHNAPDYDNAKAIGLHRYVRTHNPSILAHIERCSQIGYFRTFMTLDSEDGVPTTHPLRFAIVSANDDAIYRAVPLITLGSDDQHGKFNRVWAIRADIDPKDVLIEGKSLLEMDPEQIAAVIKTQRGKPDAIFHEINLKRHRGVVTLEEGLRAGYAQGRGIDTFRHVRDEIIDYLDEKDRPFLNKALDAFSLQYAYSAPADDVPQPYVEEEIWTAMGDIKYTYVADKKGKSIRLPNVIREMAQDQFKLLNDRIGDTLRDLMRPQPLELEPSVENAFAYVQLREKKIKKLNQYQSVLKDKDRIFLPAPHYDPVPLSSKSLELITIEDVYATLIQDRLYLMDRCPGTTRSYDVQQRISGNTDGGKVWQSIPFEKLADMPESQLLALKDEGRLRVRFEKNPNHPVLRFSIRYFMENNMGELLGQAHRDFYAAETALYANGPSYIPSPELHRIMSAPRIQMAIERMRQNIKVGSAFLSATRAGERGAGSEFISDDFSEAILESVDQDTLRRQRKYPQTDKRKFQFSIDPLTNRPLLKAKYEIPDGHFIVQIPDAHTENAASHHNLGHTCLVLPDVPGLYKAKHIVLEEELSGRRYYAAESAILKMPPRSGAYEKFYQMIDRAYNESGKVTPSDGIVLSCAELAPIAKTKDPQYPSIRIPEQRLLATRNPRLANFPRDEVLSSFIIRKYDLRFKRDQKIRLRAVNSAGDETGWEGVTRIDGKATEITLKDLLKKIEDPAFSSEMDRLAYDCGYNTPDDLKAVVLSEFTRFSEDINHPDNVLLLFKIAPVKRISYWTPHAPRACFERKMNDPGNAPETPPRAKLARKEPLLSNDI